MILQFLIINVKIKIVAFIKVIQKALPTVVTFTMIMLFLRARKLIKIKIRN